MSSARCMRERCGLLRVLVGGALLPDGPVAVRERVEDFLRLPGQVGVGARRGRDAALLIEDLDDAVGGQVRVRSGRAVRGAEAGEAEPEEESTPSSSKMGRRSSR